jgi:outer membrane biosynthesis protein TonB
MKLVGMISTAVLSLTLVAAAPVYAQEQHDQQEEQKSKPDEKKRNLRSPQSQRPKPAAPEKNAKPEEKNAKQEPKTKPEEKNAQQANRHSMRSAPVAAAFPQTVTRPTLDSNTRFVSTKATTAITASSTVAIRSDSLTRGPATGSTRKTFMLSTSTACITCATHRTRALTLHSASHCSRHRKQT